MTYSTCRGCVHGTGYCAAREAMKAQVKGLAVTSIKWKCKHRRPVYQPGEAIWAETYSGHDEYDGGYSESAVIREYPAVVIRQKGSSVVAFIEPGTINREDWPEEGYPFEPKKGNGHIKIPIARTKRRDAVREHVCCYCERIVRLKGHEDYCRDAPLEHRRAWEGHF